MTGEIIKILPLQKSRNGNTYWRIEFKMDDGSWMKTDLCPDYRNWNRWKKLLKVGNKLFNLKQKDYLTIDADSEPYLLRGERAKSFADVDLAKMGVFG